MGTHRMQDLLKHSGVKIRDGQQEIMDIISECKACQWTNTVVNFRNPEARLRGKRRGVYWEVDFTGFKSGNYEDK